MTHDELEEVATLHALGVLSAEEEVKFREFLATASEDEKREVAEIAETAALLPLPVDRVSPPAEVKTLLMEKVHASARAKAAAQARTQKLMQEAPAQSPAIPKPKTNWMPFGVTTLVLLLVIGFSAYVASLMGTLEEQNARLAEVQETNKKISGELAELKNELNRKEELLGILSSHRVAITLMDGLKPRTVAFGKILWDQETGTAILQVTNLAPPPADKDYQLWVMKGKTPMSAGVFAVKDTTVSYFKIENLPMRNPREIAAFAVTLEPKGGVPSPTGAMYLAGSPRL
jgi:anti-sigma-K factor RskA